MPKLIRLYITQVLIGFAISAVFVALLLGFNIAGLGDLVVRSDMSLIAVLMLWFMNGIVFAGVQFAWKIMSLAEKSTPSGGNKVRLQPVLAPQRGKASK